ncbi:hypothetical protein BJV78DRAFT_261016 [Lactifluus subvellereus]|nr:hypothetical protein BJV78DRAFT_261016 [Lactifluus subvellereus]
MPPTLLSAAFFARMLPSRDSSDHEPGLEPDDSRDPEKKDPSNSGSDKDQNFNIENDDRDDPDQDDLDDFDEHEDTVVPEGAEDGPMDRQGVPLTSTGTMSSSLSTSLLPSFLKCLLKLQELLFGSQQDQDVLPPSYRRIPIISGSLIPFSILLQIPGLTEHWYVRTSGNQIIQARKNSAILIVSLAISMLLAVVANIALIYRFLERRVKRSTIICILALTLHDILNIVTVLIFGIKHRFNDNFTYGEAFWMTICSTIISMITNFTLVWDLVKTPNFSAAGSGITPKQRALVIITIIFLTYLALGALITSLMMSLTFLDGLFLALVTTLTIGFGDIVPKTTGQRVVVCLYAVFGIVILGAGVRLTSGAILEGLEIGYRARLREYKRRRRERKHEREQARRWRAAVEKRLVERGLDVWTHYKPAPSPTLPNTRPTPIPIRRGTFVTQAMYLNTEALPPDVLESAAQEAGVLAENFIWRKFGRRARQQQHHHPQQPRGEEAERSGRVPLDFTWTIDDGGMHAEEQQRCLSWCGALWKRTYKALRLTNTGDDVPSAQQESSGKLTYRDMVNVLKRDERRSLYTKIGLACALFLTFWTIGSLIFCRTEGWAYGSAMYFCFITFTTIGYGDLAPGTALGRAIFVFWALFGVGAMTVLIAVLSDVFSSKYHSVTHKKTFDRAVRRYRQGQGQGMRNEAAESGDSSGRRLSQLMPALQANYARMSTSQLVQPECVSQPALTLAEAEARLRTQIEVLPGMILKEVHRLRDHTRYFLIANGHAGALGLPVDPRGNNVLTLPKGNEVPEEMKELLDDIAREDRLEERLKLEVWDDVHARNTLFVLSLEKGARSMVEAAELALKTLAERNQLLAAEERASEGVEEISDGNEPAGAEVEGSVSPLGGEGIAVI